MKNTLRVLSVRGNRNGDTMWKRGIKIPASTFDFHNNDFFYSYFHSKKQSKHVNE